jgi:hypothetical protein
VHGDDRRDGLAGKSNGRTNSGLSLIAINFHVARAESLTLSGTRL